MIRFLIHDCIRKKGFLFVATFLLMTTMALSQNKNTVNIGIILDIETAETTELLERLKLEVKAVVGEDAIIQFPAELQKTHNFSVTQARSNYEKLIAQNANLILAVGTSSGIMLQNQESFSIPTILLGSVTQEFEEQDLTKTTSGIKNFTYLTGVQYLTEDLKTFKDLTDFENIGIAIEKGINTNFDLAATFDPILNELDATYKIIPFQTTTDILNATDNIDALYMAGGFYFTDDEIKSLSQSLIDKGVPSFTNTGFHDVALGFMGTNRSDDDITQVFRRVALTIEDFVNGGELADQKVFIDTQNRLSLNFNTMDLLGVPIKYSLIAQTDFVGEFKNFAANTSFTLLDIINKTFENNLFLQSQQKTVDLTEQDVKSAKSNYYPTLTANGSFLNIDDRVAVAPLQPEFSVDANINLNQTIYSEAASAGITIQENLQKAQQANFSADLLDAVLESSNLYFNALINKVNVKIQSQNLQLTRENLRIARQNFEAGQSGKSDMLRFESQLAQNTQTLIEAVNQLEQAFIRINQSLNQPVNTEIDVNDAVIGEGIFEEYSYTELAEMVDNPTLREPLVAFLIEEAKRNSPELESLDYNLKAVDRSFKLNSWGRIVPTVVLQANFNQNIDQWGTGSINPDPSNNYNVGINVSVPILDGFRNNIDRQTFKIQQEQLEINKANTALAIETNISTGVLDLINQIANIRLAEVSVRAAEESLDIVQASYSEGAVSIIQLIDAQNNFLQAKLSQAGATYNFLLTAIQLERFMGYNFLLHTEEENNAFQQRFLEFLDENIDRN